MNISRASELSGLSSKTLRYYEDIGLVAPARADNGYRQYSRQQVQDLVFLRRCRQFGFSIDECARMLALFRNPDRHSRDVHELAEGKLAEMNRHIEGLCQLRDQLSRWTDACANNSGARCNIIESLAREVPHE